LKKRNLAFVGAYSSLLPCGVEEETERKKQQGDAELERDTCEHTPLRKKLIGVGGRGRGGPTACDISTNETRSRPSV